jgi:TolA-binding protein
MMRFVLVLLAILVGAPAQAQIAICMTEGCEAFNSGRDRERQFQQDQFMRQQQWQHQQNNWAAQARHNELMDAYRRQQMQLETLNQQRANESFRPWCGNGMRC